MLFVNFEQKRYLGNYTYTCHISKMNEALYSFFTFTRHKGIKLALIFNCIKVYGKQKFTDLNHIALLTTLHTFHLVIYAFFSITIKQL